MPAAFDLVHAVGTGARRRLQIVYVPAVWKQSDDRPGVKGWRWAIPAVGSGSGVCPVRL